MEYSKEDLETLLKAFKILEKFEINERQSLTSIKDEIKELYIKKVSEEL